MWPCLVLRRLLFRSDPAAWKREPPKPAPAPTPAPRAQAPSPQPPQPAPAPAMKASDGDGGVQTAEQRLRTKSTPLVRKIAAEHSVAISRIAGSGYTGRVTKQDILGYIEKGPAAAPAYGAPRTAHALVAEQYQLLNQTV